MKVSELPGESHVLHETTISVADLLIQDTALVSSFANWIRLSEMGHTTAPFLREALKTAGRLDDLALLAVEGLSQIKPAVLFSWFGLAVVQDAPAVMAGVGNTMELQLRVSLPHVSRGDLIADRARLRELLGLGEQTLAWSSSDSATAKWDTAYEPTERPVPSTSSCGHTTDKHVEVHQDPAMSRPMSAAGSDGGKPPPEGGADDEEPPADDDPA